MDQRPRSVHTPLLMYNKHMQDKYRDSVYIGVQCHICPENTIHLINCGLMLAHSLRRWPNIKPLLVQCLMFAGYPLRSTMGRLAH